MTGGHPQYPWRPNDTLYTYLEYLGAKLGIERPTEPPVKRMAPAQPETVVVKREGW